MTGNTRSAPPRAGAMLEALRGLGYSTGSALADIVDNSISAKATHVDIVFTWSGSGSSISVLDDGCGMYDEELQSAMTLGDKSPLDPRDASDLGRFGMGLKTASFSQCRRLTVSTVRDGTRSCLRWDLDELAKDSNGGWLLFEGPAAGSDSHFRPLSNSDHGTIVLWEVMDRIVTQGYAQVDYLDLIDRVEAHLAMVFHRLLESRKLWLTINGKVVKPWDPFMIGHPAKTWNSPVEKFRADSGLIAVECHVLPHKDKLSSDDFTLGAGANGWNAQQGFYIYRNDRLLVAGGWLGLGQGRAWNREEAFRLARISLDILNTADADWKIDIRKSTARVPVALRTWLTRLAEDTRERARKVFAFRGTPTVTRGGPPIEMAWRTDHGKSGSRYRVDEKHSAVAAVLDACSNHAELIRAMLRVLEETVPVQRIWLDTAENKATPKTGFSDEPDESITKVMRALFKDMTVRKGMSPELARKALLCTEPFQKYPTLVERLGREESTLAS